MFYRASLISVLPVGKSINMFKTNKTSKSLTLISVGDYHDAAEDTHWTPFMKTMIEYIRREYPKPWNVNTQKLVVFLMGIIVHQVSDATWHSLGIDQGFIRAMANVSRIYCIV